MPLRRVVVVNDFGSVVGGAAKVAISSASGLARAGLTVDFFCGVGPLSPELQSAGVKTHCLSQHDILTDAKRFRAAARGLWNYTAASRLRTILSECDPRDTVAHLHSWTKNLSASVIHAIHASGIPLVITIHDYFTACPNGGFFDYPRVSICDRRAMSMECVLANCDARRYEHKLWRVARQLVGTCFGGIPRQVRYVIYVSTLSRQVLEPYFESHTRWFKVGYPVDVTRTRRVAAETNRDFVFIGRLAPEKGAQLFVEAARRLGVPVLLVGDGPERAWLERRWPQTRILGWVAQADVQEAMRRARALVLPSLWYEGQPLVVLEALASGVPALVGDHNGARESVKHNVTGLVFRQGHIDSLQQAMHEMADPTKVEAMSRAAYDAYWAEPPDLQSHCAALMDVYNNILDAHSGGHGIAECGTS